MFEVPYEILSKLRFCGRNGVKHGDDLLALGVRVLWAYADRHKGICGEIVACENAKYFNHAMWIQNPHIVGGNLRSDGYVRLGLGIHDSISDLICMCRDDRHNANHYAVENEYHCTFAYAGEVYSYTYLGHESAPSQYSEQEYFGVIRTLRSKSKSSVCIEGRPISELQKYTRSALLDFDSAVRNIKLNFYS